MMVNLLYEITEGMTSDELITSKVVTMFVYEGNVTCLMMTLFNLFLCLLLYLAMVRYTLSKIAYEFSLSACILMLCICVF